MLGLDIGVLEAAFDGTDGALEEFVAKLLHLGAGEVLADVLGPAGVGGDERQVDFVLLRAGEGDLGLLSLLLDALECVGLFAQVHTLLAFEFIENPVNDPVVPIVAAKMGVAIGGFDFENTVADFEDGNVERAAAEVVDGDLLVLLLVEAVGEGGGGGLVDDAEDFEAGDAAGVLGGLALGVVEIGGNGDNGLGDFLAEAHFGIGLELGQDHGGDFRRAELFGFAVHFDFDGGVTIGGLDDLVRDAFDFFLHFLEFAAHEALDGIDGVAGVGDGLALGGVADEALTSLGEGDDGRGGALAFGVFENLGFATFHDGHAGVGRAQINAQYFSHKDSFDTLSKGEPEQWRCHQVAGWRCKLRNNKLHLKQD